MERIRRFMALALKANHFGKGSKLEELGLSKCLPGYPSERTLFDELGMSQMCQEPKWLRRLGAFVLTNPGHE
jgi:hypothetical protein